MKCWGRYPEGWELEEGEDRMVSATATAPGCCVRPRTLAMAGAWGHPGKTLPGLLSCPLPCQPLLLPRSWRALHSPGPFWSLHVGDITAGCHGEARLSKTRPLGLIPCVSGSEGFIAHPCNGAGTAGAGTAAWEQAHDPPSAWTPQRPLRWGSGDVFLFARLIYTSRVLAELPALARNAPEERWPEAFQPVPGEEAESLHEALSRGRKWEKMVHGGPGRVEQLEAMKRVSHESCRLTLPSEGLWCAGRRAKAFGTLGHRNSPKARKMLSCNRRLPRTPQTVWGLWEGKVGCLVAGRGRCCYRQPLFRQRN